MSFAKKIPYAVLAVGSLVMVGAGVACADTGSKAVSINNPGLLSGISVPSTLSEPLNNCANHTPAGASLLSGTANNSCIIK